MFVMTKGFVSVKLLISHRGINYPLDRGIYFSLELTTILGIVEVFLRLALGQKSRPRALGHRYTHLSF